MSFILISVVIFLLLALIAIRISFGNKETHNEIPNPILHASGIYSIVRADPKEQIGHFKPSIEEIRKYLGSLNVNNDILSPVNLTVEEIDFLILSWQNLLDHNIETIKKGDLSGISFYYYDFEPEMCPVCENFLKKGQFVTREEIFEQPRVIPPFHIGCTCILKAHYIEDKIQDTTKLGMFPLFKNEIAPKLPDWRMFQQSNAVRGTIE
jgi:hypothetical protein